MMKNIDDLNIISNKGVIYLGISEHCALREEPDSFLRIKMKGLKKYCYFPFHREQLLLYLENQLTLEEILPSVNVYCEAYYNVLDPDNRTGNLRGKKKLMKLGEELSGRIEYLGNTFSTASSDVFLEYITDQFYLAVRVRESSGQHNARRYVYFPVKEKALAAYFKGKAKLKSILPSYGKLKYIHNYLNEIDNEAQLDMEKMLQYLALRQQGLEDHGLRAGLSQLSEYVPTRIIGTVDVANKLEEAKELLETAICPDCGGAGTLHTENGVRNVSGVMTVTPS